MDGMLQLCPRASTREGAGALELRRPTWESYDDLRTLNLPVLWPAVEPEVCMPGAILSTGPDTPQ
jgi:hypothetical protein